MSTSDTADTTALTLRLSTDVYRRIKVAAAHENKSAAQWMRESLELVLKRVERPEWMKPDA